MGNPTGVKRDFDALERRRLRARELLSRKDLNQSEVARRLKVCRQTVSRWMEECSSGGKAALHKADRAGRKSELTDKDKARLEELLVKGPEKLGYQTPLWTCDRVADLIRREFDVKYHRGHVWKVLSDLGWSCQRPIGRARERNEEAIRQGKRINWPAIKKKPKKKAAPSFLSTKAV